MVCLAESPALYRPRQSTESHFHRLIRDYFDAFRSIHPQRYARQFGFWRPIIDKAVARFLKCGDPRHGFARVRCPDCHHEFLVAFSCKQRCICPSCSQKRTLLFGLHVSQDIVRPVLHRQFVWTLPKRLRIFFRFHRGLLGRLPQLAWQSILQVYRALLGPDALPGGIIAIQTFGSLIHFHPHLHGLITDGAFKPDGSFQPLFANLTHEPFLRLWENSVFQLLLDEKLIEPSLVAQIRCQNHSGFNVDRSVCIGADDRAAIGRLAQYMARNPFSLSRLVRITPDGKVIYKAENDRLHRFPDPASGDLFGGINRNFQVFDPLDFLAEITQHIPNKGEHLIRYYGGYSNKARASARTRKGEQETGENSPPDSSTVSCSAVSSLAQPSRWAMLIKRIYETDPLRCPRCGGAMKIIAFIEARQEDVIRKILQHIGLWHDPPARAPPATVPSSPPTVSDPQRDPGFTCEPDAEFLEHDRRGQSDQPDLPWEP